MGTLFILLKNYHSADEAFFIGLMQGLFLVGVVVVYRAIKNSKQKHKKDFDEVSKKETNTNGTSDWDEIKKEDN